MRRSVGLRALIGVCVAATAVLILGVGGASAQNFFHGIAFTKGCDSPANVGAPYVCSYQILNVVDSAHDTLSVNGLGDQVHSAGGDVNSGNILGALELVFSSAAVTCVGGSGAGTAVSPYVGATSCTLPFGTSITTNDHSFYTVQAADFGLANHQLADTATLNWADLCDVGPPPPNGNCTLGAQTATAGSSATVLAPDANIQITPPSATNHVGDPHTLTGHVNVDTTGGGNFVNAPDGTTINFTIDNGPGSLSASSCQTSGGTGSCTVVLTSNQTGTTTVSAHTDVNVGGVLLHRDTNGVGANSNPATKLWINAAITIAPSATNEVGQPHTFTATLLFDTGAGLVPAGANQPVTVTLTSANGANPVPAGPFNLTTNAQGQVQVTFTSATPGTVTGHATWTGSVNGSAPFTVSTNGVAPNSGDAVKTFVDAYIEITPPTANNPLNVTHTYTAHVFVNNGSGPAYTNAPDGTVVTFTLLPGSVGHFTGGNTCTTAGGTGTCTIDTTSSVAGDDTMQASTTLAVGGVSLTRTTGQPAPGHANSGNAIKHWIPPAGGLIAPTQTTCSDVLNNTAATLDAVNYSVVGGKIGQGINPGVFFYYAKITTTTPNQVVTVTQSNTSTNNAALFQTLNGQARLWSGDCSKFTTGTLINGGSGASFTVPVPGNYIIGIKYDTKSIAGTTAPVPADITYNFISSLGASTAASVLLHKQK